MKGVLLLRPPPPPPPHDGPTPSLRAQIERDFGSMDDFRRALNHMLTDARRGGYVWLVCTPGGRLRLVRTARDIAPLGKVLFRFPAHSGSRPPNPDWKDASDRFDGHMGQRPPFPMP